MGGWWAEGDRAPRWEGPGSGIGWRTWRRGLGWESVPIPRALRCDRHGPHQRLSAVLRETHFRVFTERRCVRVCKRVSVCISVCEGASFGAGGRGRGRGGPSRVLFKRAAPRAPSLSSEVRGQRRQGVSGTGTLAPCPGPTWQHPVDPASSRRCECGALTGGGGASWSLWTPAELWGRGLAGGRAVSPGHWVVIPGPCPGEFRVFPAPAASPPALSPGPGFWASQGHGITPEGWLGRPEGAAQAGVGAVLPVRDWPEF